MNQTLTPSDFVKSKPGTVGLWQFSKTETNPTDLMRKIAAYASRHGVKVSQSTRITFDKSLDEVGYLVIAELLKT